MVTPIWPPLAISFICIVDTLSSLIFEISEIVLLLKNYSSELKKDWNAYFNDQVL